jgi:hypothetical protein
MATERCRPIIPSPYLNATRVESATPQARKRAIVVLHEILLCDGMPPRVFQCDLVYWVGMFCLAMSKLISVILFSIYINIKHLFRLRPVYWKLCLTFSSLCSISYWTK